MTTPMNFGGLSSGVQWNDVVDATIKAMEARNVTPITDRITLRNSQKDAWTKLQDLVNTLNSAAIGIRRTGFAGFQATVPTSIASGRSLLTASATSDAVAGRYRVEVLQTADTAKIAGGSVADTSAARGLSGSFTVNGTSISVDAADSLLAIRDKINSADTGVTASIVSEGGNAGRLVLTNNASGATSLDLGDGAEGLGRELGFLDSRSKPISSATISAAVALGLSVTPPPASIRVGNVTVTVDLSTESISSIAAKINAAGGSAQVETEQYGDETRYRLVTDGNVTAVDADPNSQAVVDALGMTAGGFGSIQHSVQTSVFTDASDNLVTASTALTALKVDGASANLAVGDAINIRGTRGDGTLVTYGIVVEAGDTVQSLLDKINDASSGFGSGARTATASVGPDGRIRLTDDTGGASRLSLSMSVTHADGGTESLGAVSTSVVGRSRELQQGRDAIVVVDGQQFTRSSNTFSDVISGVALTLQSAEPGTTIDVSVERDSKGATDAVKKVVDAYNAIQKFFDEQRVPGAPLYADSGLRNLVSTFTTALRTEVTSNSTYGLAANVGLVLDRYGQLTFDEAKFTKAFAAKPDEIESLLGFSGIGGAFVSATDAATRYGMGTISTSINSIIENVHTLTSREADQKRRLEDRRLQLIEQFTKMEEAMTRLQQQSGSLLASLTGLQNGQN